MNETSKTLRLLSAEELGILEGRGLDIGCGPDPVRPDVQRFDIEHGDANRITEFLSASESFDYVFSSHCLEHMHDPDRALAEWWTLVRPGGTMIVIVPDEDLYEQGYWPSLFNPDHKATFTLAKARSWSPVSRNLAEMARTLERSEVHSVRLQDAGYERRYLAAGVWPRLAARLAVRLRNAVTQRAPVSRGLLREVFRTVGLPVDQTEGQATAQNILIVRKVGPSRIALARP